MTWFKGNLKSTWPLNPLKNSEDMKDKKKQSPGCVSLTNMDEHVKEGKLILQGMKRFSSAGEEPLQILKELPH